MVVVNQPTILCLCQELRDLSRIHRYAGFNLFIFQVFDMLKTHNDNARLELSTKGQSTKINGVLKLYSKINYCEVDDKKKIEVDIAFNFKNFIESLYYF